MYKLLDLRFLIGLFFLLLGILLLFYSFSLPSGNAFKTNLWCGIVFMVFGLVMIILSFQKDAHDELLPPGE